MRKSYIDGPFGQLHLRTWEADGEGGAPLVCLHPSPFSGRAFETIAPYLSKRRAVIAPDYPGYGESEALEGAASVEDYAQAAIAVAQAVGAGGRVDMLGFHTGCLVAAEAALSTPDLVNTLVLIDVPTFAPDKRASMAEAFARPVTLDEDITSLSKAWQMGFLSRIDYQSRESAFQMFVDHLRPGPAMNAAFFAAFTYDWEARFDALEHRALVLATQSSLLDASREAAKHLTNGALVERLDIKKSVLDAAAEPIAGEVLSFLA